MPTSKEEILVKWKDVSGFEPFLKISNTGIVILKERTWKSGRWVTRTNPEKLAALFKNRGGYLIFGISVNGVRKNLKVHRLVAKAFILNPKNKPQVNHKDGNKLNNNDWNLEWATGAENMHHAKISKLMKPVTGEKHGTSKLKEAQVKEILLNPLSEAKIAAIYKVSSHCIHRIKSGIGWKHLQHKSI